MAAREVRVTSEASPSVEWLEPDGTRRQMRCRLIVGADGRSSSVRAQMGAEFEVDEPAHLIAGMLVRANEGMVEDVNLQAREADLIFFSFPQGDGLARMYLCFPTDDRSRFAGPDGQQKFLQECDLNCLDGLVDWSRARPAGPCATFAGEDSRAPRPLADGVVLIGDAAGYENPIQGQGLSMALQDVHDVSSALISDSSIAEELESYTVKRAIRQRLANLGVTLEVWANEGFTIQDPAVRAARYEHIRGDEVLAALEACFMTGFDTLPQDLTRADLNDKLSAVA
jgi:2-polyprenyl-6-methoxyphenol hydroxylase-like FAD-dependent oxidoreductase